MNSRDAAESPCAAARTNVRPGRKIGDDVSVRHGNVSRRHSSIRVRIPIHCKNFANDSRQNTQLAIHVTRNLLFLATRLSIGRSAAGIQSGELRRWRSSALRNLAANRHLLPIRVQIVVQLHNEVALLPSLTTSVEFGIRLPRKLVALTVSMELGA